MTASRTGTSRPRRPAPPWVLVTELLTPPVRAAGDPRPGRDRAGAVGLVVAAVVSVQSGAAFAALLFPRAGATGMVVLRLGIAALLLLVLCRPRLRGHDRAAWGHVVAFGVVLAGMNTLFYLAIERIPLGLAVTLEVLGPLVLAVASGRRVADAVWALLALAGVASLGQSGVERLDPVGVALALAAGACWAGYIVLSARVGARFPGSSGLALAMTVAALAVLPLGLVTAGSALLDPVVLGVGAAVAVLSSALPYSLELRALRRLPAATFGVLMSLGPAAATVAGLVVLGQALTATELLAVVLVVVASAGAVGSRRPA